MPYDPAQYHRRSIRHRAYDYRQPGVYYVTVVTHRREPLFEDPVLCRLAETMWQRLAGHFPGLTLDVWVVMPNHVHGILVLDPPSPGPPSRRGNASLQEHPGERGVMPDEGRFALGTGLLGCVAPTSGPPSGSVGAIVGNFKAVTARRVNQIRRLAGAPVWQRNYYEHIIRNEREQDAIREYIRDNPLNWALDLENPNHT